MPPETPDRPGLHALVVDDEEPARAELAWLLERDPRIAEVRTAAGGEEALRTLDQGSTDVVFCDIDMPGLDGLTLARVFARFGEPPRIVFVTAHERHAVDAFDLDAADYLVKPVREARLAESIRKVVAGRGGRFGGSVASGDADETIPVELGGVTSLIRRSDVVYVRAQGDYARLHTATGSHLVRISLTALEERWADAGFVRIHRSTLVALPAVTHVRTEAGRTILVVPGGVELQVSRRHGRSLRDLLLRRVAV